MKTSFILILLFLLRPFAFGQLLRIRDSTGTPIPYATIEVPTKGLAQYTDSNGRADITPWKLSPDDFLIFSAIGHREVRLKYAMLAGTVLLGLQPRELPEVVVATRWKEENVGTRSKKFQCSHVIPGPGAQFGRQFAPPAKRNAHISRVRFPVRGFGGNAVPVRLRIYRGNPATTGFRDVLVETVVQLTPGSTGWIDFNIDSLQIPFSDTLLFAAEFFDTDPALWATRTYKTGKTLGPKKAVSYQVYGPTMSLTGEGNGLPTWNRFRGNWLRRVPAGGVRDCDHLAVQVLVKYPD